MPNTGASHSITIRLQMDHQPGLFAKAAEIIGRLGGNIGAIDIVKITKGKITRDVTVDTSSDEHKEQITEELNQIDGMKILHISDRVFLMHLGGKIEVNSRFPLQSRDELSMAYTPGVARICEAIHKDPQLAHNLTIKKNTVAIVSDGTAVLGLGDIGPEAAMPVMEGKAMLFKEFGGVDAFPICLDTRDTEEIIRTVKAIAPGFGGVNLEDIAAPRCFEIERRLQEELNIPIFHDDQHGTAIVMIAGLINALKVVNKDAKDIKAVVAGVGAAGTACTKMMLDLGIKNIIGLDRTGTLYSGRDKMNDSKVAYAEITNPHKIKGGMDEAIKDADLFVGLSGPGVLSLEQLKTMAKDPIVFAMSNPTPEIMPEVALPHVAVMATGRSDYPNQLNNVLCFPGIFKGALKCRAQSITEKMKLAAAYAIAETVKENEICADYIIPGVFNKDVARNVAKAVKKAYR
ncbi:NAD-dependent malic enzyme [Lentisphaera araneosa HTCC2155]|uniref:NAD-dependent malic enzyme n=1 Tax=Lentisphaera araneosa HTCC2155 TaxID=313628 RepID=A6DKH8_9BACT|nr:NAD-dependent malic enzyme [Lentisphaera araneosa]EDM27876.1 NAD-dependent malic enzyme [Lentisphaera araneosa HTCC2155]